MSVGRDELLAAAAAAARSAHAPFSRFRVGAAVAGHDGTVHLGCNLESATYTMTVHAEAAALCAATLAGVRPVAVAVVCLDMEGRATNGWPCGLCRQLLAELCDPACEVHTTEEARTVAALLPEPFVLAPPPAAAVAPAPGAGTLTDVPDDHRSDMDTTDSTSSTNSTTTTGGTTGGTTVEIERLQAEICRHLDAAPGALARLEDPAARFAAERTVSGGALAQNGATLTALRSAHRILGSQG